MSSAKVAAGALALVALLAATSSAQEKPMSFVGKTLVLRYESGLEVKARYKSATELEWEALAGPAKGRKGTETIASVPVAPDVFFISWLEKEGTSVSNVLDLHTKRVFAFVTFGTDAGRKSFFDRGTVEVQPDDTRLIP